MACHQGNHSLGDSGNISRLAVVTFPAVVVCMITSDIMCITLQGLELGELELGELELDELELDDFLTCA